MSCCLSMSCLSAAWPRLVTSSVRLRALPSAAGENKARAMKEIFLTLLPERPTHLPASSQSIRLGLEAAVSFISESWSSLRLRQATLSTTSPFRESSAMQV